MAYSSVLDSHIDHILVSSEEIDVITTKIADKISVDFKDSKRLVLLCILKGSVVFMGDLMKKVTIPVEIDFMKVSSYSDGTKSSGRINIMLDLHRSDLSECDILIVEDIIDSGRTLSYLVEYLRLNGANSVKQGCAFHCESSEQAAKMLIEKSQKGDIILFKASRGMKAEECIAKFKEGWKE